MSMKAAIFLSLTSIANIFDQKKSHMKIGANSLEIRFV